MGCRHKRAGTAGAQELRTATFPAQGNKSGMKTAALRDDQPQREPALPPMPQTRLSYRQLGSFRGRRIFETGLSLLHLQ